MLRLVLGVGLGRGDPGYVHQVDPAGPPGPTDLMVAAFADRLRDAVDLDMMRGDLATVAEATVAEKAVEPAHISVWMNECG